MDASTQTNAIINNKMSWFSGKVTSFSFGIMVGIMLVMYIKPQLDEYLYNLFGIEQDTVEETSSPNQYNIPQEMRHKMNPQVDVVFIQSDLPNNRRFQNRNSQFEKPPRVEVIDDIEIDNEISPDYTSNDNLNEMSFEDIDAPIRY